MKILRIILIIIGLLLIITQMFYIIMLAFGLINIKKESYDFWDYYFAPFVLVFIGALLLFIAYRINKKIKRKKAMDLIKSLPGKD
jgi:H+/Cl- antiporter ClcA